VQLIKILDFLKSKNIDFKLHGESELDISQVSSLDSASRGEISFLTDPKLKSLLRTTKASVIILSRLPDPPSSATLIVTPNPYYVYALVAQFLNPYPERSKTIAASALVSDRALLGRDVTLEDNVVIKANVTLGEDSFLDVGVVVEEGAIIGRHCRIGANVVIAHNCVIGDHVSIESGSVIGGDGFGYANHQGQWEKIPQLGRVIIGNKVFIGNNVTIDRGALKDTIIQDNCIIDNQVHIAHNVEIGYGSAVAGQAGFAGSTILGKHCMVGGQVGFTGHITITDGCHFMAKSGVTHNITKSGKYSGFPAQDSSDWQKSTVRARQLDKMAKQIKELKKRVDELSD